MKPINTAVFSFENLIRGGYLYVDKTALVWDLAKEQTGIYFLSRPRRFGKSLLLSTFEAFFKGKKELFKGLAIEKLAPEKWETFPVIKLDMAQAAAPTVAELEANLKRMLANVSLAIGVPLANDSAKNQFQTLIATLYQQTGKQVVILVDEYDKPILDALGKPEIGDILDYIRGFYQEIKSANDKERFVFITGVTKFAHTSIFSGMNNPTDLTMAADAATLLGYTQEELEASFAGYIDATAKKLAMPREALLAKVKEWYDGFRFEENSPTVYNPVSVGKFFINGKFLNYWYDTGTPKFLVEIAKTRNLNLEEVRNKPVAYTSFDKYEVNNLEPFTLAVQTGYLTIRETRRVFGETRYLMDYPNREVREAFENFLLGVCTGRSDAERDVLKDTLRYALADGNADAFLENVKPLIAGLPWGNLGDTGDDPVRFYEGYFRNLLSLLLSVVSVENIPEARTSDGQIDLVAKVMDWTFVFELKVARAGDDTAKLLDAALDQAINQKHYAEKYRSLSKHVKVIAVVFDSATRRLAAWKAADAGK